jgi:hypothetical protein
LTIVRSRPKDRPNNAPLAGQHDQIADATPAIGDHDRQPDEDAARRMQRSALPCRRERRAQQISQPDALTNPGQQRGPRTRRQPRRIRRDFYLL